MAIAKQKSEQPLDITPSTALSVIDGGKNLVQDVPEGLLKIREMLNKNHRSAERIYDKVLSSNEREILCFAAGLKRQHLTLKFSELDAESRISLRKAILICEKIYRGFNKVSALSMDKFLMPGEKLVSNINNPLNFVDHGISISNRGKDA